MYNYDRQPNYSTPPPMQTAVPFINPTVLVQAPTPEQNVSSIWMGSVCFLK